MVLVSVNAVCAQDNATAAPGPLTLKLSRPAYSDLGRDQHLSPLLPKDASGTLAEWERRIRPDMRRRWEELLGKPAFGEYDRTPTVVESFALPEFRATLLRQPTGPDTRQLVLIMEPLDAAATTRPGAVVPFYHPDAMAGWNLQTRQRITDKVTTQFGRHLVLQGFVVVCTEAFPYNTVPEPADNSGLNWWGAAAQKLLVDHPGWTGMGKLVHDTRRAVDLLLAQPNIDPDRIVAIGHSLGGKMVFYTGCLDDRIKATIATDFGIGWEFTNWQDPWYLGTRIQAPNFPLAHHQLLALHAPRPFLLIAGQYDKPESWQYLNEARRVYALHGKPDAVGMFDHGTGHQPTEESMRVAYGWLAEQFSLAPPRWDF